MDGAKQCGAGRINNCGGSAPCAPFNLTTVIPVSKAFVHLPAASGEQRAMHLRYQGPALIPPKVLLPVGILIPSNTWFIGLTSVSAQTVSRSVHLCAKHTETQTTLRATSVAIGRIYMHCVQAMRPNNVRSGSRILEWGGLGRLNAKSPMGSTSRTLGWGVGAKQRCKTGVSWSPQKLNNYFSYQFSLLHFPVTREIPVRLRPSFSCYWSSTFLSCICRSCVFSACSGVCVFDAGRYMIRYTARFIQEVHRRRTLPSIVRPLRHLYLSLIHI